MTSISCRSGLLLDQPRVSHHSTSAFSQGSESHFLPEPVFNFWDCVHVPFHSIGCYWLNMHVLGNIGVTDATCMRHRFLGAWDIVMINAGCSLRLGPVRISVYVPDSKVSMQDILCSWSWTLSYTNRKLSHGLGNCHTFTALLSFQRAPMRQTVGKSN